MRKLAFRILVLAILGCPFTCGELAHGQNPSQYTDSEKSLKQLIEELQDAAEKDDSERFRALAEPLYFAGYESWFKEVFGERLGKFASEKYASRSTHLVDSIQSALKKLVQDGHDKPQVEKLNEPCSGGVLQNEYPTLFARKKKVPLYSVRYRRGATYKNLGFFIYTGGSFRYLGHVDLGPMLLYEELLLGSLRVGGNVQAMKVIHRVNPSYPERARRAQVQGTVRLYAILGYDGRVSDLQFVSGHCWLTEAAIAAVSQWRYQPTLVNGEPVEVHTTIDVTFTLSR